MTTPRSTRAATPLRVAAVQMRFAPSIDKNLGQISRAVRTAVRRGADAILFPECATTGYGCDFRQLDRTALLGALNEIGRLAREHHVNLLVVTPLFRGNALLNCLLVFDRSGRAIYRYAKCHLTAQDRKVFTPGNALALFEIDGIPATALICHERRFPELVRLPVMAGARLIFHPNAGMDSLAVSRTKRGGRDGIAVRAFENAVPYVFANSVGPQGGGRWSAGDSKIVDATGKVLKLANNSEPAVLVADLNPDDATAHYAIEAMTSPRFLAPAWRQLVRKVRIQARQGIPTSPSFAR